MYTSIAPSVSICPVGLDELKSQLRMDQDYDDAKITRLGLLATEMVEDYLSRYLVTRDVLWTITQNQHYPGLDGFDQLFLLPWQWTTFIANPIVNLPRPATTVNSVTINVWDSDPIVLVEGTDYDVETVGSVGRIRWKDTAFRTTYKSSMQIDFTSGFSANQPLPTNPIQPASSYLPYKVLHVIMLLVTKLYEHRGDEDFTVWSPAVESLLAPSRYVYFG